MIRILSVHGDVLVEDRGRGYSEMAYSGLNLPQPKDVLIVTGHTSRATLMVGGKTVALEPSSYLHFRPNETSWWDRHGMGMGGTLRNVAGRIWKKVDSERPRPPGANPAIGIRG